MAKLFEKWRGSGLVLFARELLHNPSHIGAAFPSSNVLARAMAEHVPINEEGLVIELGAGTGVVTKALLKRGINKDRLLILERAPNLAKHLRDKFPELKVIEGNASHLSRYIPRYKPISAIVSSLPLLSLPKPTVDLITAQFRFLLKRGGILIQYTYSLKNNNEHCLSEFKKIYSKQIWFNLPPARIEVYQLE